jgi:hypothetical protein
MPSGKVLICAPTGRDGPLLVRYLLRDGVQSVWFDSIENLTEALDEHALAIIIAEEALLPRGVESLFQFLKNQPPWSDIALLLLTIRHAWQRHHAGTPHSRTHHDQRGALRLARS